MPKKTKAVTPLPASAVAYLEGHADVRLLARNLEYHDEEYLSAHHALFAKILKEEAQPDIRTMWRVISELDGVCMVESSARMAGFIMGFEYCRRLIGQGGAR